MTARYFKPTRTQRQPSRDNPLLKTSLRLIRELGPVSLGAAAVETGWRMREKRGRQPSSAETLAKLAGVKPRTMQRYLAALIKGGHLVATTTGFPSRGAVAQHHKGPAWNPGKKYLMLEREGSWPGRVLLAYMYYRCQQLQHGCGDATEVIASQTGLGRSTIDRTLSTLVKNGALQVVELGFEHKPASSAITEATSDSQESHKNARDVTTQARGATTPTPSDGSTSQDARDGAVDARDGAVDARDGAVDARDGAIVYKNCNSHELNTRTEPSDPAGAGSMASSSSSTMGVIATPATSSPTLSSQKVGTILRSEMNNPRILYLRLSKLTIKGELSPIRMPSFEVFEHECERCCSDPSIRCPESVFAVWLRGWYLPSTGARRFSITLDQLRDSDYMCLLYDELFPHELSLDTEQWDEAIGYCLRNWIENLDGGNGLVKDPAALFAHAVKHNEWHRLVEDVEAPEEI